MNTRSWSIWSEGYAATGESGSAACHGVFWAETFEGAVEKWMGTLDQHSKDCVDIINLTFWGCRLFDNLDDARKSYG